MSKKIALFVGPSGSGKSTIANYLVDTMRMTQIDSYTTRPPRFFGEPGHTFVDDERFDKLTDLVGYTDFNGYRYCATSQQVEESDIYVIDVAGIEYFKEHYHGSKEVNVFFFVAPQDELIKRMLTRGDCKSAVEQRVINDAVMFKDSFERLKAVYEKVFVIENYDIEKSAKEVLRILKEE